MILIFTNKVDPHADAVIRELGRRNVPVFRLNSEDILTKYDLNLTINSHAQWSGTIIDEMDRVLALENLRVAWFRKPEFDFSLNIPLGKEVQEFVCAETKALIEILYALPDILWINDPFIANSSKVKFQQLLLAQKKGIRIPRTLITTVPQVAKTFLSDCYGTVLTKAIYAGNVTINGLSQGIPSQKVTQKEFLKRFKSISISPTQLQEYIDKVFELRVTVFGDSVFAVRIDSQQHKATRIDWREYTELNPHSTFELPSRIHDFCVEFLREQGLLFGALDFIVTHNDEYVFLENNPFGQYLWLENMTGVPLTNAMCDLLVSNLD